jgi:hypothetical protein
VRWRKDGWNWPDRAGRNGHVYGVARSCVCDVKENEDGSELRRITEDVEKRSVRWRKESGGGRRQLLLQELRLALPRHPLGEGVGGI